jgi:hypothetical protein
MIQCRGLPAQCSAPGQTAHEPLPAATRGLLPAASAPQLLLPGPNPYRLAPGSSCSVCFRPSESGMGSSFSSACAASLSLPNFFWMSDFKSPYASATAFLTVSVAAAPVDSAARMASEIACGVMDRANSRHGIVPDSRQRVTICFPQPAWSFIAPATFG